MGAKGPEHVGIYIGDGKFVEAPHTGAKIRVSSLASRDDYVGARTFA
jgi:cell wall-associated NlpC family hydrolase